MARARCKTRANETEQRWAVCCRTVPEQAAMQICCRRARAGLRWWCTVRTFPPKRASGLQTECESEQAAQWPIRGAASPRRHPSLRTLTGRTAARERPSGMAVRASRSACEDSQSAVWSGFKDMLPPEPSQRSRSLQRLSNRRMGPCPVSRSCARRPQPPALEMNCRRDRGELVSRCATDASFVFFFTQPVRCI